MNEDAAGLLYATRPALMGLLRRVILETPIHEEAGTCMSCDAGVGRYPEETPHKADCIVAEAARLSLMMVPALRGEIESYRWPRWEGDE